MMDHYLDYKTVLELLPAYVLEALEPEEMTAVAEYITAHRHLLKRLEDSEEAVVRLAETAPHAPLAPTVKQNLMARVHGDIGSETSPYPTPSNSAQFLEGTSETAFSQEASVEESLSWRKWFQNWWQMRTLTLATAVAALIALIGMTTYSALLSGRLQQMDSQLSQLQATNTLLVEQVDVSQESLTTLNTQLTTATEHNLQLQASYDALHQANLDLIEQVQDKDDSIIDVTEQFVAVANRSSQIEQANSDLEAQFLLTHNRLTIASSATQAAILHGEEASSGAFYATDENALLVLHGLTPLPADQTYQFWFVTPDNEQIPAGLVDVHDTNTPTWTDISLPATPVPITAVGISIEPAGGSPEPTGYMLLEGEIS